MERLPRVDEQKKEETTKPARRSPSRLQEDNSSENGSQWNDDHVTEIYKDYDLYMAAKNGNLDEFRGILDRVSAAERASFGDILSRLSPVRNTFLHIAAKHGNEDIVNFIAAKKPSLVLSKNFDGETALHLAAKAGDASMVKALVPIHQDLLVLKPLPQNEPDENNLLRAKNHKGNTALHEALFNGWDSVAEFLMQEDPELSYFQNEKREFALYLAAKAGFANCASLILRLSTDEERLNEQFKKKSPIRAAIKGKHRDVLEAMFDMKPSLIQLRDGKGRNPLHYSASLGYHEEVRYLLKKYADNATQRDKSSAFPIHLASTKGHVDVVRTLLQDFPDPGELLDRDGRNILHLAAMNKRYNTVSFVLKTPDLEGLINMKDKCGNTPLHLATRHWRPKIVYGLTLDRRVDIKVVNDKGMTALDVAEHYKLAYRPYTQLLTRVALITAGTPRSLPRKTLGPKQISNMISSYKERNGFLLLISILVATVTFAAGFTVPGGYNSSDSGKDQGVATMLRHKAFHIFVFSDVIAMYSSIVAAAILFWAQLGDSILVFTALRFAVPFLWIALITMFMAFNAGIYLAISKLRWLSNAFLVMVTIFSSIFFLFLLPLLFLFGPTNRVLRYLSYYPFCFLALISLG